MQTIFPTQEVQKESQLDFNSVKFDSIYEVTISDELDTFILQDLRSDVYQYIDTHDFMQLLRSYFTESYSKIYKVIYNGKTVRISFVDRKVSAKKQEKDPVKSFYLRFMNTQAIESMDEEGFSKEDLYEYGEL